MNSPFSAAMLQHLDEPGLDVDQLMRRVRNSVLEATNERQIPWNSSSLRVSFVLNTDVPIGAAAGAATAASPRPSAPSISGGGRDVDREAWGIAERLDTAQGYRASLDSYCPGGRYCGFAEVAIVAKRLSGEQQQALADLAEG